MSLYSKLNRFLPLIRRRQYSHGPTAGSVYSDYKEFDMSLRKLRPDLFTTQEQIDEALKSGKINTHTAQILKAEVAEATEAGSKLLK